MLPPDSLPTSIVSEEPDFDVDYSGGCFPANRPETAPGTDDVHEADLNTTGHTIDPQSHDVMTGDLGSGSHSCGSETGTSPSVGTGRSVVAYSAFDTDDLVGTFLTNGH